MPCPNAGAVKHTAGARTQAKNRVSLINHPLGSILKYFAREELEYQF